MSHFPERFLTPATRYDSQVIALDITSIWRESGELVRTDTRTFRSKFAALSARRTPGVPPPPKSKVGNLVERPREQVMGFSIPNLDDLLEVPHAKRNVRAGGLPGTHSHTRGRTS